MFVLITYDVCTSDPAGAKRLRKVSKLCERYGMRVQNSVFEVLVDAAQLAVLKAELKKIIDLETDSVRFYRLGNTYENKIDTLGKSAVIDACATLLL
ncbi:MAG: CRISPR-associated endonuclease Cas2 [Clostridiales bacterium]|nr:CRISPR-associated endonuclease Cas2 [Candidatus Apopatocola equi]